MFVTRTNAFARMEQAEPRVAAHGGGEEEGDDGSVGVT